MAWSLVWDKSFDPELLVCITLGSDSGVTGLGPFPGPEPLDGPLLDDSPGPDSGFYSWSDVLVSMMCAG